MYLYDRQGRGRDGVGEVTTGGRYGPHDGNGPFSAGGPDAARAAGALVEGRKTSSEVGRVTVLRVFFVCEERERDRSWRKG